MSISNGYCTLAELKRYLGIGKSYTATTISFTAGTKTIADSALGLEGFPTGASITVSGSTSNDGTYTIATGGTAASIVTSEALGGDEAAGDTVTITDISSQLDDPLLESLVEAASRAIDAYCSRRFYGATDTRYYEMDAVEGDYLRLDDDLISITTLTNGDSSSTTITSTYYWLWPRNSGPPYHSIRLKADQSTHDWEVDTDYFITVTGSWGWGSEIPNDVQRAIIRWASYLYHQKDSGVYDVTTFPSEGILMVPQGMPRDVRILLDPYRRTAG